MAPPDSHHDGRTDLPVLWFGAMLQSSGWAVAGGHGP
jgi:hypothetical protein